MQYWIFGVGVSVVVVLAASCYQLWAHHQNRKAAKTNKFNEAGLHGNSTRNPNELGSSDHKDKKIIEHEEKSLEELQDQGSITKIDAKDTTKRINDSAKEEPRESSKGSSQDGEEELEHLESKTEEQKNALDLREQGLKPERNGRLSSSDATSKKIISDEKNNKTTSVQKKLLQQSTIENDSPTMLEQQTKQAQHQPDSGNIPITFFPKISEESKLEKQEIARTLQQGQMIKRAQVAKVIQIEKEKQLKLARVKHFLEEQERIQRDKDLAQKYKKPLSPLEIDRQIKREQDEAYNASLKADAEKAAKRKQEQDQEKAKVQRLQDIIKSRKEKLSLLGSEPAQDDPQVCCVAIRLPDGSRITRRFYTYQTADLLFTLIEGHLECENYKVNTHFPRKEVPKEYTETIGKILDGPFKQIVLFVEST